MLVMLVVLEGYPQSATVRKNARIYRPCQGKRFTLDALTWQPVGAIAM